MEREDVLEDVLWERDEDAAVVAWELFMLSGLGFTPSQAETIVALEPRLRRIDDLSLLKTPYRRQLSWRYRLLFAAAALVPRFRDLHRLLRYQFSPSASTPARRAG